MLALALLLALDPVGHGAAVTPPVFEPLVPAPVVAPTLAPAEEQADGPRLSYSFVEIGASRWNLDQIDDEADSYYGRASLGLFKFLYVFGGYENQSVDFQNTDTDLWSLGAGAHFDFSEDLSIFGDLAWLYNEIDSDVFDDSSNGTLLRLGGRWMALRMGANTALELNGAGLWYSLDDSLLSEDDAAGFEAGARLHFIDFLSVGVAYTMIEDDDLASVNARFSF